MVRCEALVKGDKQDGEALFRLVHNYVYLRDDNSIFEKISHKQCPTLAEAKGHGDDEKIGCSDDTYGELKKAIATYKKAYDDVVPDAKTPMKYDFNLKVRDEIIRAQRYLFNTSPLTAIIYEGKTGYAATSE